MATQEKSGGTLGNVITIIIFIAVITVALWGAISAVRLAPRLFNAISNTFTGGSSSIEFSVPSVEVRSGEVFTLSWKDTARTNGLYTISYACTNGVELGVPAAENTFKAIPCDVPFAIPASQTSIKVLPRLTAGDRVSVPVSIQYLADDGSLATEGKTTVTINKASESATTPTPTPAAPKTTTPKKPTTAAPAATSNGKPDFVIRPIAAGVVDPMTGVFVQKNIFGSYELVSYKFDVANRGTAKSGSWTLTAELPTRSGQVYNAPTQQPLGVGDHTEFTLNFTQPISGSIRITVDPTNSVSELSEGNNSLSEYVSVVY